MIGLLVALALVVGGYAQPGPHEVRRDTITDAGGEVLFRLHVPTDLDAGPYPIVAWGNGSFEHADTYEGVLDHLASWGFVVIAAETDSAGSGAELLDGIDRMVAANEDPASPFSGALDTSRVGAAGHSQGAGGAMRAATLGGGRVTSVATYALPREEAVALISPPEHRFDPGLLTIPAFYLGGEDDLIAPPGSLRTYYDRTPGPAAVASIAGADHNVVQGDGGATLGYLAAWFRLTLADDPAAAPFLDELLTDPALVGAAVKGFAGPSAPPVEVAPTTTAAPSPAGGALARTGLAAPLLAAAVAVGLALRARSRP